MAKYSKKTQNQVEKTMRKMKKGELKSGKSGKTVKDKEQAIAIALSEARDKGYKAPEKDEKKKSAGSNHTSHNKGERKTVSKRKAIRGKKTSGKTGRSEA